jgi:hypothetical protein
MGIPALLLNIPVNGFISHSTETKVILIPQTVGENGRLSASQLPKVLSWNSQSV